MAKIVFGSALPCPSSGPDSYKGDPAVFLFTEPRSCVKVEPAVLGSLPVIVRTVSVDVNQC